MKIKIKHRYTGKLIFEHEAEKNTLRLTLEHAVSLNANLSGANLYVANLSGANLSGANLSVANLSVANLDGANLDGANLSGAKLSGAKLYGANLYVANLSGANLSGANLSVANLSGANLSGANLSGANLSGANLSGANLSGANLSGAKLSGQRPVIQIGPIGSRRSYLSAFITEKGLRLHTGCFLGTRDEFVNELLRTHGSNEHASEYQCALALIDKHVELWTPKKA